MLKTIASYITYNLLQLDCGSRLADTLMQSYFPPERTKQILSYKKEFIGNIQLKHSGKPLPSLEKVKQLIKEEM